LNPRPPCTAPALVAIVTLLAAFLLSGCTMASVSRAPATDGYADRSLPQSDDPFPNWPLPPDRIEALLRKHDFRLVSQAAAGGGTTGAQRVSLHFASEDVTIPFKWKKMEGQWKPIYGRLDGVNNAPRKELAAWLVQKLFLDPEDFVVPLTLAHAAPVGNLGGKEKPTLAGTNSVLGVLTVWLEDITLPDPLLDNDRFNRDYTYAYYLSNLNLLTYLIKHHDGRPGNFLVSKNDARRQAFAIDNGVAFGGIFYNWFVDNWNSIRVPALRKDSIDRLRELREEDLEGLLGVVAQFELDENGLYQTVPPGKNLDDDDGVRIEDKVLQLGLTDDEIEDVWERIEELIEVVDVGEIPLF
jgi:hypothetical protein